MSKVVLVEDDTSMRSLLKILLEFEGLQVISYAQTNKDEIRLSLQNDSPDLLLLDVHIRDTDGIDLLRTIRQDEHLRDLRIIMTSGMDVSQRCYEAGADNFLLKPYMPEDLIYMIRQQLEHQG